jgi:uncharacterized protein DUF6281
MTILRTIRLLVLAALLLSLGLAACGGETTPESGGATTEVMGGGVAASCAFVVRFDGHLYSGYAVKAKPSQGDSLGTGTFPPCDDTGGALPPAAAEQVEVAAIDGVDPSIAIMLPGRHDVILVREDAIDDFDEELIR